MRMEKKKFDNDERSALSQEKIDALEAIDFAWAKPKGDTLWESKFVDLKAYMRKHGHCNVPTKYKVDTALGRWVSTQRKQYKEMQSGKPSLMTKQRAKRLETVGFRWNALDRDDEESRETNH